jgi:hypothetical protein
MVRWKPTTIRLKTSIAQRQIWTADGNAGLLVDYKNIRLLAPSRNVPSAQS